MGIGERIISLRKQKKMTQSQLAKALGLSRQAVSKWETGLSIPDASNMLSLAEVLDSDVEFLSTGQKTARPPAPIVVNLVQKTDKVIDRIVEKPVVHKVVRVQYRRIWWEYLLVGILTFLIGFLAGKLF